MNNGLGRSEADLLAFISSVMSDELEHARQVTVKTCRGFPIVRPWAFEYTPASSEPPAEAYLRKVREADFVFWLIGRETSQPVVKEITECVSAGRRLLAFKLPSETRNATTERLMGQVASYAKWAEVRDEEDLKGHIEKALSDEFVRAIQNPAFPNRTQKLEEMKQLSISRCKHMWTSLGVPDELATELAADRSIGDRLEIPDAGVLRVEGDQGIGKTLAAERLFQKVVDQALDDSSQPFPLFISARDLQGPLAEFINRMTKDFSLPSVQGVIVIIDGLDEVGVNDANRVLDKVAVYSDAYPRTKVVVTYRPLPGLNDDFGGKIPMPAMENDQSMELISKIAGREFAWFDSYSWSASVRDASQSPLFAVMIGSVLRDNVDSFEPRRSHLVTILAKRALQEADNSVVADELLQKLAVKSISSGKRVYPRDVSRKHAEQKLLSDSRLVNELDGTVDFTLSIFREWYAARALLEDTFSIDDTESTSDRWVIPLTIAIEGDEKAGHLLIAKLAKSDPGLATLILREIETDLASDESREVTLGTAMETGEQIRKAMESWGSGLGALYKVIGPVDAEGNTVTLGIKDGLITSWYQGSENLPPVVELPKHLNLATRDPDWPVSNAPVPNSSLLPWIYTKNYLVKTLLQRFRDDHLALKSMSIDSVREYTWAFSVLAQEQRNLNRTHFNIREILQSLDESIAKCQHIRSGWEENFTNEHLRIFRSHLLRSLEKGEGSISEPWPGSDQQPREAEYAWQRYSPQRLLERTEAIYEGALRIYEYLVDKWFNAFSTRLTLYRCLPVRMEGRLELPSQGDTQRTEPLLTVCPRAQPGIAQSIVVVKIGSSKQLSDNFFSLRGAESPFLSASVLRDIFEPLPATNLALDWLSSDLRGLGWKTYSSSLAKENG